MTSPTSAGPSATPLPPGTRLLHWSVAAPLSAVTGVGSAVLGVLADLPVLGVAGAVVAAVPAVLAARRVPSLHVEQVRARTRAEAAEQALAGARTSLARSERALCRANDALALADRALATRGAGHPGAQPSGQVDQEAELEQVGPQAQAERAEPAEHAEVVPERSQVRATVDLIKAARRPVVDLVKATAPSSPPAPSAAAPPAPSVPSAPAAGCVDLPVRERALAAAAVESSVPAHQATLQLVHQAGVASVRSSSATPAAGSDPDPRVDTAELQKIWDLGEAARSRTGRGRRVRVGAEVDALPDRPHHPAVQRRRARHRA